MGDLQRAAASHKVVQFGCCKHCWGGGENPSRRHALTGVSYRYGDSFTACLHRATEGEATQHACPLSQTHTLAQTHIPDKSQSANCSPLCTAERGAWWVEQRWGSPQRMKYLYRDPYTPCAFSGKGGGLVSSHMFSFSTKKSCREHLKGQRKPTEFHFA